MKMELKELKKDFKDCLSEIDFKEYDPWSKKFMKASFIGQMWFLIKALQDDDDVEEELEGAEKYMEKWQSTGDTAFRDIHAYQHLGLEQSTGSSSAQGTPDETPAPSSSAPAEEQVPTE